MAGTPLPIASVRPAMPPFDSGFPVGWIGAAELVHHPGHFPLACASVLSRDIDAGADQATFIEFLGEAAGDALELLRRPFARIDLQSPLRAAGRHIDQRAIERHQRCQRFDLFSIRRIANATLHRFAVLAVARSPADEAVHAAAQEDAEPYRVGRVAAA